MEALRLDLSPQHVNPVGKHCFTALECLAIACMPGRGRRTRRRDASAACRVKTPVTGGIGIPASRRVCPSGWPVRSNSISQTEQKETPNRRRLGSVNPVPVYDGYSLRPCALAVNITLPSFQAVQNYYYTFEILICIGTPWLGRSPQGSCM